MNLSWKLLFCVLNRNYLVTKLCVNLSVVSVYVEYMYMCVHMCIIILHVSVCEYIFSYFPCHFGIENDYMIMFISHTKV